MEVKMSSIDDEMTDQWASEFNWDNVEEIFLV